VVQTDLEKKNTDLLSEYAADLKQVQEIFMLCHEEPPINDNAPPRAGAVTWVRALVERVQEPMERFQAMNVQIMGSEEGKECLRAYDAILKSLERYEQEHREAWAAEIDNTASEKLKQALLRKNESTGFMYVNFDPALVCLLRETKYFLLLGLEVPDSAMSIFQVRAAVSVVGLCLEMGVEGCGSRDGAPRPSCVHYVPGAFLSAEMVSAPSLGLRKLFRP
jgi:dynein heavy chain